MLLLRYSFLWQKLYVGLAVPAEKVSLFYDFGKPLSFPNTWRKPALLQANAGKATYYRKLALVPL